MSLTLELQSSLRSIARAAQAASQAVAPKPAVQKPAAAPAPAVKSQPLKVMSYNFARAEHGSIKDLARLIKSNQVDVVALQELSADQARQLQAELGPGWSLSCQGNPLMNGKAVLSRYPIKAQKDTTFDKLSFLGESIASCIRLRQVYPLETRGAQDVTLQVNGREVHVFNAHLTNCNAAEKQSELAQLDRLLSACPGERVCAGDFNTARGESRALDALLAHNLDALALKGAGGTPTCGNRQIDFILGGDVAVKNARVLTPGLSDHQAVVADLLV
jgi:endonuclease/exonuclease/phosphatase (EEP) superfamily protein YafD